MSTLLQLGQQASDSEEDNDSNNSSDDDDILDRAHRAAHHMAVGWIRSVFREVCYQLWKEHWRVEHVTVHVEGDNDDDDDEGANDENGDEKNPKKTAEKDIGNSNENENNNNNKVNHTQMHCRLHLTAEMVQQAQETCRRVADRWSQRLGAQGHVEFSKWVQRVVQDDAASCFADPEDEPELKRKRNASATTFRKDTAPDQESDKHSVASTLSPVVDDTASEERHSSNPPTVGGDASNMRDKNYTCTFAALRNLSVPHDNLSKENYQYLIAKLDEMGYAHKTYWPYDWNIIQEAAKKIPERMHSRDVSNLELQLVPKEKDLASEDQQPQEPLDNPDMPPPRVRLVDNQTGATQPRGRKRTTLQRDWTKQVIAQGRERRNQRFSYEEISHDPIGGEDEKRKRPRLTQEEDRPRPPSTVGDDCTIPYQDIAAMACPALDAYIHDETNHDSIPNNTLLGALKPLGHVHHGLQFDHDYSEGKLKTTTRARKRQLGRSIIERYGSHQEETSAKPIGGNKRWSKIARTVPLKAANSNSNSNGRSKNNDGTGSTAVEEEHYFDLDLGECFLDLQDEAQNEGNDNSRVTRRRLYAFSSLELFLRDEDDSDKEMDLNQNDNKDIIGASDEREGASHLTRYGEGSCSIRNEEDDQLSNVEHNATV